MRNALLLTVTLTVTTLLAAAPGDLIWQTPVGLGGANSVAVAGGRVYSMSGDGILGCVRATNGAVIWTVDLGSVSDCSPLVWGDYVYVGCDDRMHCRFASSGAAVWSYQTGGSVESSPAISGGKVYFGSLDNYAYCLYAETGEFIWSSSAGGPVFGAPTLALGRVYVAASNNYLYCLDAGSGAVQWSVDVGGVAYSPTVCEDRVYVIAGIPPAVLSVNALTGAVIWSAYAWEDAFGPVAAYAGRIYVHSLDRISSPLWDSYISCLDARTGSVIWQTQTASGVESSSSPAVSCGYVYVGTEGGLCCLSALTGSVGWTYGPVETIHSSPAVYGGCVYFQGSAIYCLEAAQWDSGEWPMYCHDIQRTGCLDKQMCVMLGEGWNLIGHGSTVAWPVNIQRLWFCDGSDRKRWDAASAENWIQDPAFYYEIGGDVEAGYRQLGWPCPPEGSDELERGRGYWVLVNRPGLSLLVPEPEPPEEE